MSNNILTVFADNPALQEAVREVFTRQFDQTPVMGADTTDEVLGQFLRARIAGLQALEAAFKEINQHKTMAERPTRDNPAR